jgi:hypothetical protein
LAQARSGIDRPAPRRWHRLAPISMLPSWRRGRQAIRGAGTYPPRPRPGPSHGEASAPRSASAKRDINMRPRASSASTWASSTEGGSFGTTAPAGTVEGGRVPTAHVAAEEDVAAGQSPVPSWPEPVDGAPGQLDRGPRATEGDAGRRLEQPQVIIRHAGGQAIEGRQRRSRWPGPRGMALSPAARRRFHGVGPVHSRPPAGGQAPAVARPDDEADRRPGRWRSAGAAAGARPAASPAHDLAEKFVTEAVPGWLGSRTRIAGR